MKNKFVAFLMSFLMVFSVVGATPITTSVYAEENPTPTQETTQVSEQEELVDSDVVYQEDLDAYGLVYDEGNSANLNCIIYTDGNDWFRFAHSGNAPDAWYIYNDGSWFYTADSVVNNATVEMSAEPSPEISASTNKEPKEDGVVTTIYGEDLVKLDNGEFVLEADDFSDAVKATPRFFSLFSLDEPAQATLTDFKYIGAYTGTAPFDTTLTSDQAGFDRTQEDKIVRSYDKVIYRTSYSIGVDAEGKTVTSGTLHFEAYLNVQPDVATWDLNAMNWLNNASITEENGSQKLSGDITFNGGQMAPRIGVINWAIAVGGVNPDTKGGAINGTKIPAPEFSVWVNDDAPEDVLSTDIVTVSSKTTMDASIQYVGKNDAGQPYWGINVALVANKPGNGIKGMEIPINSRPLTMALDLDYGMEYYGIKSNSPGITGNGIPTDYFIGGLPYDDGNITLKTEYNQVYNGGTVSATGSGSAVNITLSGFQIDNIINNKVTRNASNKLSDGIVYDDDCYPFASLVLLTTKPTQSFTSATKVNANITDLTAVDNFGDQVKDNDSTNNTANYHVSVPGTVPPPGNAIAGPGTAMQTSLYRNNKFIWVETWVADTTPVEVYAGDRVCFNSHARTDSLVKNAPFYFIDGDEQFIKFDGDMFKPISGLDDGYFSDQYGGSDLINPVVVTTISNSPNLTNYSPTFADNVTMYFVTKADGTNWSSDAEMLDAHWNSGTGYHIYKTADEVIDSGEICVGYYGKVTHLASIFPEPPTPYYNFNSSLYTPLLEINGGVLLDDSGLPKPKNDSSLVGAVVVDDTIIGINGNTLSNTTTSSWVEPYSNPAGSLFTDASHSFIKATYDANGNMLTNSRSNNHFLSWADVTAYGYNILDGWSQSGGLAFHINTYSTYLNHSIVQTIDKDGKDTPKEVFNLDAGQRLIDFNIESGTTSPVKLSSTTDPITISVTLPKGLAPVNPTATSTEEKYNITYGGVATQDETTNGGAGVKYTGNVGSPKEDDQWITATTEANATSANYIINETANSDGTTELTWIFTGYPVSYALPDIHYQATIGDEKNSKNDVVSGTSLTPFAEIYTEVVPLPVTKYVGFTPIRMGGGVLLKKALPSIRTEENPTIGFDLVYTDEAVLNASNQGKVGVIDIFPYAGDEYGNGNMGNYSLSNSTLSVNLTELSFENAPTPVITFYYTLEDGAKVKNSVGDFLNDDTLYDFSDPMWKTTTDVSSLNGQKVTAIGWIMENQGDTSTVKFHYEYTWADADEMSEHQNNDAVKNRAYVAGENGILQKTYSEDVSRSSISKQIIGINDVADSSGALNGTNVQVGDVLTYQINYSNPTGDVAKIDIYDNTPAGTEFVSAENDGKLEKNTVHWILENVAVGESGFVTFKVVVTEDAIKTIENTAYDIINDNPNLKYETNTIINPVLKYTAVKGSTPANGTRVYRGDEIEYSIILKNTGENVIPFIQVRDYIPAGTTYVANSVSTGGAYVEKLTPTTDEKSGNYVEWVLTNLKPNDEATVTFKVTVNESCNLDQVENVALYEETRINPGKPGEIEKDPAHETNKIVHPLGTPILEVIKGSNPVTGTIVNNGDVIEYSVTVKNTGDGVAKFVPIRDYIPAGTTYVANSVSTGGAYVEKLTPTTDEKSGNYVEWVLTNLKPNEEATVTFKVTVNESCNLDQVENVALYEETPKDPGEPGEIEKDPAHETNKIIHPLGEPLIETVKSSNPENGTTVQKGDTITYTVTITNNGTGLAKFVQVRDYIPDGTTYVVNSITSPLNANGVFVQANTHGTNKPYVEWVLTNVEPGESREVTFKVTVNTDITLDKVTNVALYETFPKDPGEPGEIEKDPAHETNKIIHPLGQPSVTVVKSSDPVTGTVVKKGQTITYYLDIKNNGTAPVAYTQVRDYIPLMTTYVQNSVSSVTGANGAYVQTSADGAYVEWVIDNLGVGETRRVSFKVTVNQNAINKILNEALYDWTEEDPGKPGEITKKPSIKTNQTVHPLVIVTQTGDERTILPYVGLGIAGLLLLLIALVLQKKKAIKKSTKN